MQVYLTMILEQYKRSIGKQTIDLNSEEFVQGFYKWIEDNKKIADVYTELLRFMKLYNFVDSDTFEIGKGKYDSIVTKYNTTIITPYSEGLQVSNPNRIITADFRINEGRPSIIVKNSTGNKVINFKLLEQTRNLTFMTQNPYTNSGIKFWDQLHNSGEYNVIVGMFGDKKDKDRDKKLNQLKAFRDSLNGVYRAECATSGDYYFGVVASTGYNKKKEKIRSLYR